MDQGNHVFRITIDEKLDVELFRIEVCVLKDWSSSSIFNDDPNDWVDIDTLERALYLRKEHSLIIEDLAYDPEDEKYDPELAKYLLLGGTTLKQLSHCLMENLSWKELREGQVYLCGAFRIIHNSREEGLSFITHASESGNFILERVDNAVKTNTMDLYNDALKKGGKLNG